MMEQWVSPYSGSYKAIPTAIPISCSHSPLLPIAMPIPTQMSWVLASLLISVRLNWELRIIAMRMIELMTEWTIHLRIIKNKSRCSARSLLALDHSQRMMRRLADCIQRVESNEIDQIVREEHLVQQGLTPPPMELAVRIRLPYIRLSSGINFQL